MAEVAVSAALVVALLGYLLGLVASLVLGEKLTMCGMCMAAILALPLRLPVISVLSMGYISIDWLMSRTGCYTSPRRHRG